MFEICLAVIACLGGIMYIAWRAGSAPTKDDPEDYGAPHG